MSNSCRSWVVTGWGNPFLKVPKEPFKSQIIGEKFPTEQISNRISDLVAKLRDVKEDDNEQLLKCKMEAAGHGGMSGRDNAIKELAEEYSFILKNAKV